MPSAVGYQPTLATENGDNAGKDHIHPPRVITSVQAVYVPADDLTDSRSGNNLRSPRCPPPYLAVKSLNLVSIRQSILSTQPQEFLLPISLGRHLYNCAQRVKERLQRYNELQDIIAIHWKDELSEEDKLVVHRARRVQRFLSQPFHVAEQFTGIKGALVSIEDTIKGFNMMLDGKVDQYPVSAFMLVGTIEDAIEKGEKILAQSK
jgi:F-type H+-transporting ATPase subunit beta